MKKFFVIPFVLLAALACNRGVDIETPGKEIVLDCGDSFNFEVQTKAETVTSVPDNLYWGATTGSAGSETTKWASALASVSSNKISTGKYQTASPTTYNYYVASHTFSIVAAKTTMTVANNNIDILSARVSSNSATPSISLGHIFARTGTLTCNAPSGYNIKDVSWKIVGKGDLNGKGGIYNMTTDRWESASTKLTEEVITSSSNLYLIGEPDGSSTKNYTIKVTFTLWKGGTASAPDWSETCTHTADVTLVKGKINNITGTASYDSSGASQIVLNVNVTAWGTNNITGLAF